MEVTTLNDLKLIIDKIFVKYKDVCDIWDRIKINKYTYSQDKYCVKDIEKNKGIMNDVLMYSLFLNELLSPMVFSEEKIINRTRVKNECSIWYKYIRYSDKTIENKPGSIPINKCFNDLFGLRIISKDKFDFDIIQKYIKNKYSHFKCLLRNFNGYKAIHIYFKIDNFHYQWELQLWNECDTEPNYKSHQKYKQDYTEWEKWYNEFIKRSKK